MNETLKSELNSYFKIVNDRAKFVQNEISKRELKIDSGKIEEGINEKLQKKAIEFLNKSEWDWEKGRVIGDRIGLIDGKLKVRKYKCHRWNDVNFVGTSDRNLFQILPIGFKEVVTQLNVKMDGILNIDIAFKEEEKTNIKVELLTDDGIKKDKVNNIGLNGDNNPEYDLTVSYCSGEIANQLLVNEEIFNIVLGLLEKRKQFFERVQLLKDLIETQIDKIIDDDFDKILVAERLKE